MRLSYHIRTEFNEIWKKYLNQKNDCIDKDESRNQWLEAKAQWSGSLWNGILVAEGKCHPGTTKKKPLEILNAQSYHEKGKIRSLWYKRI